MNTRAEYLIAIANASPGWNRYFGSPIHPSMERPDGSVNAHLIPGPETPPCTRGYNHPAEGWLVSPEGRRVRPMCWKCADARIIELGTIRKGHFWFEPL